jgi:serine/threonine-protein kinase
MSRDEEDEYFADGLTEELINALTRVEGLRVVSRTSVFRFKGVAEDICRLGKKLRATVALEGSVRRAGNQLRITAQLINVADGYHLWSQRYDREMREIFDVQDELAQAIVERLKTRLVGKPKHYTIKRYTDNIDAYTLFLRGRYHYGKRVPESVKTAVGYFEQALALDPEYALARAGLADCYVILATWGLLQDSKAGAKAKMAALQALRVDPELSEPHATLGIVSAIYDFDWAAAERELRRSLELNPDYAAAHHWYASLVLLPNGRFQEAMAEARRTREIDPVTPSLNTGMGAIYLFERQYEQAIQEFAKVQELDPGYPMSAYLLGKAYMQKGMWAEAIGQFRRSVSHYIGYGYLGCCHALAGQTAEAEKVLLKLQKEEEPAFFRPFETAVLWMGLGDTDAVFRCLGEAQRERSFGVFWLKVDPLFDPVRSDPRYTDLLRRMNLEP